MSGTEIGALSGGYLSPSGVESDSTRVSIMKL